MATPIHPPKKGTIQSLWCQGWGVPHFAAAAADDDDDDDGHDAYEKDGMQMWGMRPLIRSPRPTMGRPRAL